MSEKVNVDNFKRAETDNYFGKFVKDSGLGTFAHRRAPAAGRFMAMQVINEDHYTERLQQGGILREEHPRRLLGEQRDREAEGRRLGDGAVGRSAGREHVELHSDLARLELPRATVSPPQGDSRRHLEVPRGAARGMTIRVSDRVC